MEDQEHFRMRQIVLPELVENLNSPRAPARLARRIDSLRTLQSDIDGASVTDAEIREVQGAHVRCLKLQGQGVQEEKPAWACEMEKSLGDRVDRAVDRLQVSLNRLDAKTVNMRAKDGSSRILPFPNEGGERPPYFPATRGELVGLSLRKASTLLSFYGLEVDGNNKKDMINVLLEHLFIARSRL